MRIVVVVSSRPFVACYQHALGHAVGEATVGGEWGVWVMLMGSVLLRGVGYDDGGGEVGWRLSLAYHINH